jgi:hypothetical protein
MDLYDSGRSMLRVKLEPTTWKPCHGNVAFDDEHVIRWSAHDCYKEHMVSTPHGHAAHQSYR